MLLPFSLARHFGSPVAGTFLLQAGLSAATGVPVPEPIDWNSVLKVLGIAVTAGAALVTIYRIRSSQNLQKQIEQNRIRKFLEQRVTTLEAGQIRVEAEVKALTASTAALAEIPNRLGSVEHGQKMLQEFFAQSQARTEQQFAAFMEYARRNSESSLDVARLVERDKAREKSIEGISADTGEVKRLVTDYLLGQKGPTGS